MRKFSIVGFFTLTMLFGVIFSFTHALDDQESEEWFIVANDSEVLILDVIDGQVIPVHQIERLHSEGVKVYRLGLRESMVTLTQWAISENSEDDSFSTHYYAKDNQLVVLNTEAYPPESVLALNTLWHNDQYVILQNFSRDDEFNLFGYVLNRQTGELQALQGKLPEQTDFVREIAAFWNTHTLRYIAQIWDDGQIIMNRWYERDLLTGEDTLLLELSAKGVPLMLVNHGEALLYLHNDDVGGSTYQLAFDDGRLRDATAQADERVLVIENQLLHYVPDCPNDCVLLAQDMASGDERVYTTPSLSDYTTAEHMYEDGNLLIQDQISRQLYMLREGQAPVTLGFNIPLLSRSSEDYGYIFTTKEQIAFGVEEVPAQIYDVHADEFILQDAMISNPYLQLTWLPDDRGFVLLTNDSQVTVYEAGEWSNLPLVFDAGYPIIYRYHLPDGPWLTEVSAGGIIGLYNPVTNTYTRLMTGVGYWPSF